MVRITLQHLAPSVEAYDQCALQITETWTSAKALCTGCLFTFRGIALSAAAKTFIYQCVMGGSTAGLCQNSGRSGLCNAD